MNYKLIRMLMEQAGTPADAGSAGTPPATPPADGGKGTDTPPADGGKGTDTPPAGGQPPAATEPPKGTDTPPADGGDGKKSLLGGAKADDGKKPGTDGSADNNPDGGKTQQPGDGQPPQDPYKDLSLPDGAAVDETQMAKYKELAKTMNLKPEDAQRILDFEAERLSAGAAAAAAAWQAQVKQEHGDKLPIVMATCARAIDKLGGDELRTLLDQTGLGNHPLMVKAFYQAGSMLSEDKHAGSNGNAKGDVSFAQALYGRSN